MSKKPVEHMCDKRQFGAHVNLRNLCRNPKFPLRSAALRAGTTLLEAQK